MFGVANHPGVRSRSFKSSPVRTNRRRYRCLCTFVDGASTDTLRFHGHNSRWPNDQTKWSQHILLNREKNRRALLVQVGSVCVCGELMTLANKMPRTKMFISVVTVQFPYKKPVCNDRRPTLSLRLYNRRPFLLNLFGGI